MIDARVTIACIIETTIDSMHLFSNRCSRTREDCSRKECRTFSFFVPNDLAVWLWHSKSGEIFTQCT